MSWENTDKIEVQRTSRKGQGPSERRYQGERHKTPQVSCIVDRKDGRAHSRKNVAAGNVSRIEGEGGTGKVGGSAEPGQQEGAENPSPGTGGASNRLWAQAVDA